MPAMNNKPSATNPLNELIFTVTWKTAVIVGDTNNVELDRSWAVATAAQRLKEVLENPASGEGKFLVEQVGNAGLGRDAVVVELEGALRAYDTPF